MGSRDVPWNENAACDDCDEVGAFEFPYDVNLCAACVKDDSDEYLPWEGPDEFAEKPDETEESD